MKATDFEYRHQLLIHELIVGAAVLTYLVDRDDIVWRFVKNSGPNVRVLERSLFAVATLLIGISAWICTQARAHREPNKSSPSASLTPTRRSDFTQLYLGEFLFAIALGSLLPFTGFLILVIGEAIRLFRLFGRDTPAIVSDVLTSAKGLTPEWTKAARREAIKWGLFLTMIVFTITLKDRVAEVLIGASVLLWALLNLRFRGGSLEVA